MPPPSPLPPRSPWLVTIDGGGDSKVESEIFSTNPTDGLVPGLVRWTLALGARGSATPALNPSPLLAPRGSCELFAFGGV